METKRRRLVREKGICTQARKSIPKSRSASPAINERRRNSSKEKVARVRARRRKTRSDPGKIISRNIAPKSCIWSRREEKNNINNSF